MFELGLLLRLGLAHGILRNFCGLVVSKINQYGTCSLTPRQFLLLSVCDGVIWQRVTFFTAISILFRSTQHHSISADIVSKVNCQLWRLTWS